jgi:hypothetical protein
MRVQESDESSPSTILNALPSILFLPYPLGGVHVFHTMASKTSSLTGLATEDRHTGSGDNQGTESPDASLQPGSGHEQALDGFIDAHLIPTAVSSPRAADYHLPGPVVIPQRRPGNKTRGFIEAYPPALEPFGIQQDEFIDFIKATNEAVRASKWLGAIQLAAAGTSFVPNSIALGVSVAVQVVAGVIAKAETRWKYVRVILS